MPDLENFSLSTRVGPLPIYGWVVAAGAAGFLLYKLGFGKLASGGSSSGAANTGQGTQFQSSQSQTSTDASGNTSTTSYSAQGNGYLPGMLTTQASPMPYSLGDIYVNVGAPTNTTSPSSSLPNLNLPDVRNAQGVDLGQYRFGQDEINYLNANKGSFGITQQLITDVTNKYNEMVQQVGYAAAQNYHYGWYSPGNVNATPEFATSGGTVVPPQATVQSSTTGSPAGQGVPYTTPGQSTSTTSDVTPKAA